MEAEETVLLLPSNSNPLRPDKGLPQAKVLLVQGNSAAHHHQGVRQVPVSVLLLKDSPAVRALSLLPVTRAPHQVSRAVHRPRASCQGKDHPRACAAPAQCLLQVECLILVVLRDLCMEGPLPLVDLVVALLHREAFHLKALRHQAR